MTALDIMVLLLVGMLALRGFATGFVTESLSLLAWIAGFGAVKAFHEPATDALIDIVGTQSGASTLAVVLLFGVTFAIGRLLANRIGSASKASMLGGFDRILGFGFGAFKGLLFASLAFLVASLAYDTVYGGRSVRPDWMIQSRTYPLLNATARALVDFAGDRQKGGVVDGNVT